LEQKSRASKEVLEFAEYVVDGRSMQMVVEEIRDA